MFVLFMQFIGFCFLRPSLSHLPRRSTMASAFFSFFLLPSFWYCRPSAKIHHGSGVEWRSIICAVIEVLVHRLSSPEVLGFFKRHQLNQWKSWSSSLNYSPFFYIFFHKYLTVQFVRTSVFFISQQLHFLNLLL